MELVNFKNIDFNKSIDKELKIINFNGTDIGIVPYLNIQDKFDFVMITLQKSFVNGIYNNLKIDMYFDLHLVYMYTNIEFDAEDRVDEESLYDTLKRSGLIAAVRSSIDVNELEYLYEVVRKTGRKLSNYKSSFMSFISDLINTMPEKATEALNIVGKMDPNILKNFATGSFGPIISGLMEDMNSQEK